MNPNPPQIFRCMFRGNRVRVIFGSTRMTHIIIRVARKRAYQVGSCTVRACVFRVFYLFFFIVLLKNLRNFNIHVGLKLTLHGPINIQIGFGWTRIFAQLGISGMGHLFELGRIRIDPTRPDLTLLLGRAATN